MTDTTTLALLARLVVSLAVVLGLMLGGAALVRRRQANPKRPSRNQPMEVLARQGLTRTASIQIVRLGERAIVLGVTEHSVTYLTEGDPADLAPRALPAPPVSEDDGTSPQVSATRSGTAWKDLVEVLREKTVRR